MTLVTPMPRMRGGNGAIRFVACGTRREQLQIYRVACGLGMPIGDTKLLTKFVWQAMFHILRRINGFGANQRARLAAKAGGRFGAPSNCGDFLPAAFLGLGQSTTQATTNQPNESPPPQHKHKHTQAYPSQTQTPTRKRHLAFHHPSVAAAADQPRSGRRGFMVQFTWDPCAEHRAGYCRTENQGTTAKRHRPARQKSNGTTKLKDKPTSTSRRARYTPADNAKILRLKQPYGSQWPRAGLT